MQINAGDGWHELHVCTKPGVLFGQMKIDVIWNDDDPGFRAAMDVSDKRGQAQFRMGVAGAVQSFWVLLSRVPDVRHGLPDTTKMLLTPIGWRIF